MTPSNARANAPQRRLELLLDIFVHAMEFERQRRVALKKSFRQANGAQRFREPFTNTPRSLTISSALHPPTSTIRTTLVACGHRA